MRFRSQCLGALRCKPQAVVATELQKQKAVITDDMVKKQLRAMISLGAAEPDKEACNDKFFKGSLGREFWKGS